MKAVSSIHNKRTRHAAVTGTHLTWMQVEQCLNITYGPKLFASLHAAMFYTSGSAFCDTQQI